MPSHAPMIARAEMTGRRRKVVKFARANPAVSHRAIDRRYSLRRSTVSNIMCKADMNYVPHL